MQLGNRRGLGNRVPTARNRIPKVPVGTRRSFREASLFENISLGTIVVLDSDKTTNNVTDGTNNSE
jgi:hypothetical protein